MKKFFATFFLSILILIPAIQVEAAYVTIPNFYDITSNRIEKRIEYLGTEHMITVDGIKYSRWSYRVCDGKEDKYILKYIKKLSARRDIEAFYSDESDYEILNDHNNLWFFDYVGGQAKYLKGLSGTGGHIVVERAGSQVVVIMVSGIYPE